MPPSASPHTTNETLRKSVHIAFGFVAFALKLMPWWAAALLACAAIAGNFLVLHKVVGTAIARHERGYDAGIVLYPFAVLLLVLVFHDRLHYAAIGWTLLAFGDGVATLAGKSMRIAPLPWHRDKSWGGFLAFLVAGGALSLAVAYWMDFRAPLVVLIATLAAGIAESLPLRIDDNLTVPFAAAVALIVAGIPAVHPFATWPHTPAWLIVNAILALLGYFARSVSFSGALGGWVLGTILILGAGWPMYATLLAFFVIGTATTKLGYSRKARAGLAQEEGGRRGFSHAFANTGVAAICAIAVSRLARALGGASELELLPMFMGIASLATATADTTASEVGQLIGRRAFLPLTLRRVPVGTEGAISIEGTLAGLLGALVTSMVGAFSVDRMFGDVTQFSWRVVIALTLCAFLASYLESVAGSWNRTRTAPIPNGVLNFFNTAVGAVLMYIAWQMILT
ncbi:MAG TPA: DUF92 domain-containing protein [Thermoanaerobaculia bacterium]|nr:DUF92 domain-containing protein [Thermoanaerobaculia bacterium]